ncbi:MAG: ribosome biogenesis GTPase Der [Hyphomicrobiaceae bacterium]
MDTYPKIVIVGRPNVGKSTLFNRLTGKRSALVSNVPGLTRDRREGEANIMDRQFRLIDTAGLEEASSGSIAERMQEQSKNALASADLVLFVMDARAGATAADHQFANAVRRTGRPILLVANKCEGQKATDGLFDAYALGLGDPVAVSAEHGEGIADLESAIISAIQNDETRTSGQQEDASGSVTLRDNERPIRIAIVGRPNVGKSTLINAILGENRMITGPEPGLTRDTIASPLEWGHDNLLLFDTAGLRRKSRVHDRAELLSNSDTIRAIRFAEVVVLLIDAEMPLEHQDLAIGDMICKEGRAIVIGANKWDLIQNKQEATRHLRLKVDEKLAQVQGVPIVHISALAENGLKSLLDAILSANRVWNHRVSTAALNRWLNEAVIRHPPPATKGRRIKIRYATQVSVRPPTFVAFCSRPSAMPKSYTRYLVNSLRETFDLPGVPIRFSLRQGENPYAD